MKKRLFTMLLLFFTMLFINAQNKDLILGKWVFKKAYNNENLDKAGLEFMKSEVINKMTFNFMKNGKLKVYLMGENGVGQWSLSKDSKSITFNISEGKPIEMIILKLTKTELAIKFGLGEFLMKKTNKKGNAKYKKKKADKKRIATEINAHKNIEIDKAELIPFEVIEKIPVTSDCDSNLNKEKLRKCVQRSIAMHVSLKFNTNLAAELGLTSKIHLITTTFVIEKNGEIVNVKSEGSHPKLNAEASRVISILPKMSPGMKDGKAVNVSYKFPTKFLVE